MTQEQKDAVCAWAREGASLSEIQNRLASEFDVHLSYMDTRLFVMELDAVIQDKAEPKKAEPVKPPAQEEEDVVHDIDAECGEGYEADATEEVETQPLPNGSVQVEISRIANPRYALCGSVVFSDGEKAEWGITNDGAIALDPSTQGYKPTQEDIRDFKLKLRELLSTSY